MTAFVGNTNVLDLLGLKDALTNAYLNSATVTVTVKDASGVAVPGESWPVTMAYVAGSNGNYRAIIEDDVEFVARRAYYAHIRADGGGSNRIGTWKFAFTPQTRAE
jgi:hypothetical protein